MFQTVKNVLFFVGMAAICIFGIGLQTGLIKPPARKSEPSFYENVNSIRTEIQQLRTGLQKLRQEVKKIRDEPTVVEMTNLIERNENFLNQLNEYLKSVNQTRPHGPLKQLIIVLFR